MIKFTLKDLNKNHLKTSIYVFCVIAFLIVFEKIIGNLSGINNYISNFFTRIIDIFFPFVIGFAIAYLINPFIKFLEKNLKNNFNYAKIHPNLTRAMCILFTYFIVLGGSVWIVLYLIPEVESSFRVFVANVTAIATYDYNHIIMGLSEQFDFIDTDYLTALVTELMQKSLTIFEGLPNLINNIWQNIFILGSLAFDVIMALFIAFYFLYDKEKTLEYFEKVTYAMLKKETAEKLIMNSSRINNIFQNFITGKALDSFIIAILAFIGFSMIKAPFPSVLSLIIGVTNMIPYFGPFIGGTPVVVLTVLMGSPMKGVWATVFIIVLQQFDGNYLGPRILGNSVDLSPILIILAVVVGGALGGALGMFLGAPILAALKMFFSEYINEKYEQKFSKESLAIKEEL